MGQDGGPFEEGPPEVTTITGTGDRVYRTPSLLGVPLSMSEAEQ